MYVCGSYFSFIVAVSHDKVIQVHNTLSLRDSYRILN